MWRLRCNAVGNELDSGSEPFRNSLADREANGGSASAPLIRVGSSVFQVLRRSKTLIVGIGYSEAWRRPLGRSHNPMLGHPISSESWRNTRKSPARRSS